MEKVFQVSEFNEFISLYLEQAGEVVVEGEISELKLSQGKWIFLTLKDQSASLPVFSLLFRIGNFNSLSEGMMVKVRGMPRLHQKTARYSLFAESVTPSGEGSLKMALEKLRRKLSEEGLFLVERKRKIILFPKKVALLTAKNSQAQADFIKVLKHRQGGLTVYFYPIQVQGTDSVNSIIRAFDYLETHFTDLDAVVLVRGGGSLEDLSAFNDELVVRRIFASRFPVVTGVGHETDWTLSDLVADLRASTPSNAAELLVQSREELLYRIKISLDTVAARIEHDLARRRNMIRYFANIFNAQLQAYRLKLESLTRILSSLDYRNVLKRGYTITTDEKGCIVTDSRSVRHGQTIITKLDRGSLTSTVNKQ